MINEETQGSAGARMSTIVRDMGMGCGRSIVIRFVSVAIGFPLALLAVFFTITLASTFYDQPWVYVLILSMWLVPFGVSGLIAVAVVKRRASQLDTLFVPLGLVGGVYMTWFRQYHGTVSGRQVDVYLHRGPVLDIEISTPVKTRFGITGPQSDTLFFAELAGKQPLGLADPDLAALSVFADDEQWARYLLAETTATDALRRLTALGSSIFTRQQVLARPGTLRLQLTGNRRLFGIDITPEQARLWVDDLLRVLYAMEALPAPQVVAELSSGEHLSLSLRERNPYFAAWMGLGIFGFFMVLAILIFGAVFFLSSRGWI